MSKLIKYFVGLICFAFFNRIEARYLLPTKLLFLADFIEKFRVLSLILMGAKIGNNSYVRANLFITSPELLLIGDNTKIGPRSELFLYDKLIIGNNVEIGSDLIVHTEDHIINDPDLPLTKQGGNHDKVVIEDDVYIGSRVTILKGVTISKRVVVAAGAVVTKNLETGFIYGGVPAKKIKPL